MERQFSGVFDFIIFDFRDHDLKDAAAYFFDRTFRKKFDIIFADPPYGLGLAKKALKTLGAYDIVVPDSILMIQHEKREILPEGEGRILHFRTKKYGNTFLSIYKKS